VRALNVLGAAAESAFRENTDSTAKLALGLFARAAYAASDATAAGDPILYRKAMAILGDASAELPASVKR
jgi:hypothetical protein